MSTSGRVGGFLRHRVEEATAPKLDQLAKQVEDVRLATVDIRRIVTDDLDASNETAALIGHALDELRSTVEALRAEVEQLRARVDTR
jgi:hypothetical protein